MRARSIMTLRARAWRALAGATVMSIVATTTAARGESAGASVAVTLTVASRTHLHVSSEVLRFHVDRPGAAAVATLEFAVGVRTGSTADVVLSVRSSGAPVEGLPGNDAAVILLEDGAAGARIVSGVAVTGRRWIGSGMRRGTLTFRLTGAAPGDYDVPIQCLVTMP